MLDASTDQALPIAQGDATPAAPKAMPHRWHDRVTWPLLTGLASSAVVTLWTMVLPYGPVLLEGCTSQQQEQVQVAEQALNDGNLARAGDIGEEVLMFAPGCRCAHLLLAKVHQQRYRAAEQTGDQSKAKLERKLCLREGLQARELFSTSVEIRGLIRSCSAKPSI